MDKTGRALGTLSPIIYWLKTDAPVYVHGAMIENHILLPPSEIGDGGRLARELWEARPQGRPSYKDRGYTWQEAGTLQEVQKLQQRIMDQENRILRHQGHHDEAIRKKVHAETASRLRQRMASSSCNQWERDFIQEWLKLSESKQDEYTKRFMERNMYLQVAEFDSSHKLEDRMGS